MADFTTIDIALTTDSTVDTGIPAPNDTLRMLAQVNGKTYRRDYIFTGTGNIIIDNILENNSPHYLRFYDSSNTLYNDTVYNLLTNDITLANKQTNDYLEIADTVIASDGVPSYQNDALLNMKRVEVFAKFGITYQLIKHDSFDYATGTIYFINDDLPGSVDGQQLLIKAYSKT